MAIILGVQSHPVKAVYNGMKGRIPTYAFYVARRGQWEFSSIEYGSRSGPTAPDDVTVAKARKLLKAWETIDEPPPF